MASLKKAVKDESAESIVKTTESVMKTARSEFTTAKSIFNPINDPKTKRFPANYRSHLMSLPGTPSCVGIFLGAMYIATIISVFMAAGFLSKWDLNYTLFEKKYGS